MSFEAIDLTPRIATQIKIDKATLLSGRHTEMVFNGSYLVADRARF